MTATVDWDAYYAARAAEKEARKRRIRAAAVHAEATDRPHLAQLFRHAATNTSLPAALVEDAGRAAEEMLAGGG